MPAVARNSSSRNPKSLSPDRKGAHANKFIDREAGAVAATKGLLFDWQTTMGVYGVVNILL